MTDSRFLDRVMRIAADENPGDHYLSHLIFARKCLRESPWFAIQVARGYQHRRLTREECEGLIEDWQEFA